MPGRSNRSNVTPSGGRSANRSALSPWTTEFLSFCRIEKGLAVNSLDAYSRDLRRFHASCKKEVGFVSDDVLGYVDSLYAAKLGSRSVARHLTTLRNF
ncbi:MAG: site-specific integrase [Bryobacteraceae bacterium]